MNLFAETLAGYVTEQWDQDFSATSGPKEVRFIVQSLDPQATLALFEALDAHRQQWSERLSLAAHFRVATGLWQAWEETAAGDEVAAAAIAKLIAADWIDQEDRLTWYRNRTAAKEGTQALVVVLVGLNHATDQGGLADFPRVDEGQLIAGLKGSFLPWLERMADALGLGAGGTELTRLDELLQKVFELRPLRLSRLAAFLQPLIDRGDCYSLGELRGRILAALPFWGLPPLLPDADRNLPPQRDALKALETSDAFISHKTYKSKAAQKKDWDKIQATLDQDDFVPPARADGTPEFADVEDYRACLDAFIHRADPAACERLQRADFMPLHRALTRRQPRDKTATPKLKAFDGFSHQAVLEAVWEALLRFQNDVCEDEPLWERLGDIQVTLELFHHDLTGDEADGIGAREQAVALLRGCLGGLAELVSGMELRLPADAQEATRPLDQWRRTVSIGLALDIDSLNLTSVRGNARPYLQFRVQIAAVDSTIPVEMPFRWYFDPMQPERVRHELIRTVQRLWHRQPDPARVLPAFRVDTVNLTALFFAADAEEANRLAAQALGDLALLDLTAGLPDTLDSDLRHGINTLIAAYRAWLDASATGGYYKALFTELNPVLTALDKLATRALDPELLGAAEFGRRLYKAFLLIDTAVEPNDGFLPAAVAWGLTPAVLELSQARARFLADGFPEAVAELAVNGKQAGRVVYERLLDLARLHRPLNALVTNAAGHLSTESRAFGLLHCLGEVPGTAKSLAVQTLLQEDESDDDEDVSDIVQACEEQPVVLEVLKLYTDLHPHARDGLRILAVNVRELASILSGVDAFLKAMLKTGKGAADGDDLAPFHCTVMVYSTASSPLAMENRLTLWRDAVMERHRDKDRGLVLTVGHRFMPKDEVTTPLAREALCYDLAFLFHFLRSEMAGRVDRALQPFAVTAAGDGYFPIAEYPRPIKAGDRNRREMLLSNRQLRMQTRHSDLSARLSNASHDAQDYLVYGQVDFGSWAALVQDLHQHAHWVACIDAFVDKRLLGQQREERAGATPPRRKIVGFKSGLGAYGELNLTVSTEQDTLERLTERIAAELNGLLPHQQPVGFAAIAERIVADAEEVIGLASLQAVLGQGEQLREVIGFAAIRRLLQLPHGEMTQLLPLDAHRHWFQDADTKKRADLLAMTLQIRPDRDPLIDASVIECKVGNHNQVHQAEGLQQVCKTLRQLSLLFAPRGTGAWRTFDRRYWWAQLHRAIASRAVVSLPDRDWRQLDHALERLAAGHFEICWRGGLFTFWTNMPLPDPTVTRLSPSEPITHAGLLCPPGFVIAQVQLGYQGLSALFAEEGPAPSIALDGPAICLAPQEHGRRLGPQEVDAGADDDRPADVSAGDPAQPGAAGANGDEPKVAAATSSPGVAADAPSQRTVEPHRQVGSVAAHQPLAFVDGAHGSIVGDEEPSVALPAKSVGGSAGRPAEEIVAAATAFTPPERTAFPVPERILIGTRSNGEPVYWHFGHPALANRHLLLFGTSGSGKTYGIQCLLAEMAAAGLRSLIVDYTDGFLPSQIEPRFKEVAQPRNHFVRTERLPLSPFRRQKQVLDPSVPVIVEESSYDVATRIQSIFASVFTLGEQQAAALIRALQSGVDLEAGFSLNGLLPRLREEGTAAENLANKLEPLIQAQPFREGAESAWEAMLTSGAERVHVLQLAGLAREIQKLVTEFVLWDLWDYAQSTGNKSRPIPIVLDEIQNLDHSSDSPIDKMLREGRKFGVALMLATQTTSQFNREQQDRLFQAGHKLFFKPASTELDRFAQILTQSTIGVPKPEWAQRLSRLNKGQCWSLGPALRADGSVSEEAVLVSVTALDQRRYGEDP